MPDVRRSRVLWGSVLLLALGIRLSAAWVWQRQLPDAQAFAFPDSESYWALSERIAHRQTYEFADALAFRTPAYPAAMSPLFWITDGHPPVLLVRIVGAVLGVAVVALVGCVTWKLFDERAALIAALLCALYPGAIAMSILVLSEALFCPLMVVQILCCVLATQAEESRKTLMYASLAGLAAGLATLARPSWLLFTPMAFIVAVTYGSTRNVPWRIGAAMLVAMGITMSPWWLRNAYVLSGFVPTTTQVGASLYDGLHPGATGASDMSFVPNITKEYRQSDDWRSQQANTAFEVALNRHFASEAVAWAKQNPLSAAKLAIVKFKRMWNIWPNEASLRSWPVRLVVALGYLPILGTALLGGWKFARRDVSYILCLLPAIYFTALHMIFIGSIRYRQPPMLLLIVLAAGWISTVLIPAVFNRRLPQQEAAAAN